MAYFSAQQRMYTSNRIDLHVDEASRITVEMKNFLVSRARKFGMFTATLVLLGLVANLRSLTLRITIGPT